MIELENVGFSTLGQHHIEGMTQDQYAAFIAEFAKEIIVPVLGNNWRQQIGNYLISSTNLSNTALRIVLGISDDNDFMYAFVHIISKNDERFWEWLNIGGRATRIVNKKQKRTKR